MIVRGKVYALVFSELFFGLSLYFASVYFVEQFGILGASYAFLANSLLYAAFSIAYYLVFIGRPWTKRTAA
ncbi:hypothetical protein D9M68_988290 [compost metagenome]